MAHEIIFKPKAEKAFGDLPKADQVRIAGKLDALEDNPFPQGAEKLSGADGLWRLRSGNYRVIYAEPDDEGIIRILRIAHRREVYRRL